jgi:hypothetical protein
MYVICAAPEAKIFQPHLQDDLLAHPEKITVVDQTLIYVNRPSGRIAFTLGVPKQILGKQSSDGEEDMIYLSHWLTGGSDGFQSQETECYGLVQIDIAQEVLDQITRLVHLSVANPMAMQENPLNKDAQAHIKAARQRAEILSRAKVLRAVRRCWSQLQDQYGKNAEAGLGKYRPSKCEVLCQYVLRAEIAEEKARQKNIEEMMDSTLADTAKGLLNTIPEKLPGEPAPTSVAAKRPRRTKAEMEAARTAAVASEWEPETMAETTPASEEG